MFVLLSLTTINTGSSKREFFVSGGFMEVLQKGFCSKKDLWYVLKKKSRTSYRIVCTTLESKRVFEFEFNGKQEFAESLFNKFVSGRL